MSRAFGMIITSIWGSSKFRSLPDDKSRLAYIYLHTNDHGSSIGAYRLPSEYITADMRIENAAQVLGYIAQAGLIEYDHDEHVVRMLKWFPHNPINSPKHLLGAVSKFKSLPGQTKFLGDIAAEIIISAHVKATDLARRGQSQIKNSKTERQSQAGHINKESASQMLEVMQDLIQSLGDDQQKKAISTLSQLPNRVRKEVLLDLNIPLVEVENTGKDTPIDTPIDTPQRTDTETETHTQTHTETETETRKTDIQDDILELKAKAAKQ